MRNFFKFLFGSTNPNRQVQPVDTPRLNYLDGLERLHPEPGDSTELLLTKASRLVENYFGLHGLAAVPPPHTYLDVARHLASSNTATPAGLGADPALNLLVELNNPASELYLEAARLVLSWFWVFLEL